MGSTEGGGCDQGQAVEATTSARRKMYLIARGGLELGSTFWERSVVGLAQERGHDLESAAGGEGSARCEEGGEDEGTHSEPKNLATLPSSRLTMIQGNPNAPFFSTCSVASALTRSLFSAVADSSMYSLSFASGMSDVGMISPKFSGFAAAMASPVSPHICSCKVTSSVDAVWL